ncbi:MAG: hypothetical protein QXR59_02555 [Candidatus Bathyarchaeia archaeon]
MVGLTSPYMRRSLMKTNAQSAPEKEIKSELKYGGSLRIQD